MFKKIEISTGAHSPLGFSIQGDRANFALFSSSAAQVYLLLFSPEKIDPVKEIPLYNSHNIWHIALKGLPENALYAFRVDSESGALDSSGQPLADPYAKIPATPAKWGEKGSHAKSIAAIPKPFDWQGVEAPRLELRDLVIYEMHVRGFTKDPSSKTVSSGTFLGIIEKIPYLKTLGVTAIELMPIFEFDETHSKNIDPKTGAPLPNYWGYNPLHFFAPMRRYAHSNPIDEFKTLVRELHRNGIEVILDVVYNHTGEGKEKDYFVNFRGIDNCAYYMVDENGNYRDYTGCGNTVNTNHPAVQKLILDSLRYWIEEMHVDGFRFDLASIFTRDIHGHPNCHSPLLNAIANDPVISKAKLIAEAWDAAGLYQLGSFPKWGPWFEWNGRYRDHARRFLAGMEKEAGRFATALSGSEPLYHGQSPLCSVNFITAHDGFTLRDLVSYQQKHNEPNGEMNRDGANHNDNWNCGREGPTHEPDISELRERQMRNHLLALFLSQGIPMLLMGDEYGHTRLGNNNPYVQDNEINWFLWNELEKRPDIFSFVSALIAFRKNHPEIRLNRFLTDADVDWHGTSPFSADWGPHSHLVALTLKGPSPLYIAFNAGPRPAALTLPDASWRLIVRTDQGWGEHALRAPEKGPLQSTSLELSSYSSVLLQIK